MNYLFLLIFIFLRKFFFSYVHSIIQRKFSLFSRRVQNQNLGIKITQTFAQTPTHTHTHNKTLFFRVHDIRKALILTLTLDSEKRTPNPTQRFQFPKFQGLLSGLPSFSKRRRSQIHLFLITAQPSSCVILNFFPFKVRFF